MLPSPFTFGDVIRIAHYTWPSESDRDRRCSYVLISETLHGICVGLTPDEHKRFSKAKAIVETGKAGVAHAP